MMLYKSTRNSTLRLPASTVIAQGISTEGGLFVPESLPELSNLFQEMQGLDYCALAKKIFSCFLTDFTPEEIESCVESAYAKEKFDSGSPVCVVPLAGGEENKHLLELWHGPTCAFKDMALQILPHFLTTSLKKAAQGKQAVILVATSGDTGKAALEGFKDVENTKILVFYPAEGVSPMQKRQMETQEGGNVQVCAVKGNFDDTQTCVKRIFTDEKIKALLEGENMLFSSANSINWGRLLPQIVYYFYSYFELYRQSSIPSLSEKINIVVPTGNFGNILAAYYAKQMGLPVNRFICASNANNVLTDFIRTGVYDRKREFFATESPSMDILVSSNLERLLYALSGEDDAKISQWMKELSTQGVYDVGEEVACKVKDLFYGGFCDDASTEETIHQLFLEENYLCDTHTAVAVNVYRQYVEETGDGKTPTIIASTASPYKFSQSVLKAVDEACKEKDEFRQVSCLEAITHTCAPKQLKELETKPVRFTQCVGAEEMPGYVLDSIGIPRG